MLEATLSSTTAAAVEEKNSVLEEIAAECESAATGVLGHPLKDPKRGLCGMPPQLLGFFFFFFFFFLSLW
mgnify:CR=1 FL=1